jgi:broad specificity phosphatase PhoE
MRVLRAVNAIARLHPGQRVLVVTHAGVVNQILGTIAGQSAACWENFRPRNASLTEVYWDQSKGEVESFDDARHLLVEQLAG